MNKGMIALFGLLQVAAAAFGNPNLILLLADDQRDEVPVCAASRSTLSMGLSQCSHRYNFGQPKVSTERFTVWNVRSALTDHVREYGVNHPRGEWKSKGNVFVPCSLLGRFLLRREPGAANGCLLSAMSTTMAGAPIQQNRGFNYEQ
jgi:hypothetical protein